MALGTLRSMQSRKWQSMQSRGQVRGGGGGAKDAVARQSRSRSDRTGSGSGSSGSNSSATDGSDNSDSDTEGKSGYRKGTSIKRFAHDRRGAMIPVRGRLQAGTTG